MKTQMSIGKKFAATGGMLVVLTIALGAASLIGVASIARHAATTGAEALDGVSDSSKVESALFEMRGDIHEHIGSLDAGQMTVLENHIGALKQEIATVLTRVEGSPASDEEKQVAGRIRPAINSYYAFWDEILPLSRASKNQEAYKKYSDAITVFAAARDAVEAETESNRRLGKSLTDEALSTARGVRWMSWILLAISVLGGGGLVFFIVQGVNRELLKAVTELSDGSEQVASAAGQVSTSSQSLAQGSSQQAASLEETSASTEEITSMTRKNAENSQSAAALMTIVDQQVKAGNRTLGEMLASMKEINTSSEKISKIIKVIDEIAFQTNILALNAAVEAARAGEAGMGFAVVADEVRNLAQRSAQAAKDTAALIEESVAKSNQGSTRLNQVSEVIRSITESSAKVKTLVDEVSLGSQEQSRGIDQIAKAVAKMDQVTQSTAASAEETASASEELSAQAEAMKRIVAQLRVLAGGQVTSRRVPAPSAKTPVPIHASSLSSLGSTLYRHQTFKANDSPVHAGRAHEGSFPMEDNFTEV